MGGDCTVTEATAKQLSGDVPLPPGAVIKQQDTLVMSTASTWLGRISLSVSGEPQAVFTYFKRRHACIGLDANIELVFKNQLADLHQRRAGGQHSNAGHQLWRQ